MDRSPQRVSRAHTLGLVRLALDVLVVAVAVAFIGAELTGVLTVSYWPLFPALAGAALLIGVPSGALFGWSNEQRRAARS